MALTPGRNAVGTTVWLAVNFTDDDYADVDPSTVTFKIISPRGVVSTYVYLTDSELEKTSTGDYRIGIVPDTPGTYTYRWITTGSGTAVALNGSFVVQTTPLDTTERRYYR